MNALIQLRASLGPKASESPASKSTGKRRGSHPASERKAREEGTPVGPIGFLALLLGQTRPAPVQPRLSPARAGDRGAKAPPVGPAVSGLPRASGEHPAPGGAEARPVAGGKPTSESPAEPPPAPAPDSAASNPASPHPAVTPMPATAPAPAMPLHPPAPTPTIELPHLPAPAPTIGSPHPTALGASVPPGGPPVLAAAHHDAASSGGPQPPIPQPSAAPVGPVAGGAGARGGDRHGWSAGARREGPNPEGRASHGDSATAARISAAASSPLTLDSVGQTVGGSPGVAGGPVPANPSGIAHQVIEGMLNQPLAGGTTLVLRLDPPQLGSVVLRIVAGTGQRVRVHFSVEDPQARDALAEGREQLERALRSQGLSPEGFSVALQTTGDSGQFGERSGQAEWRPAGRARVVSTDVVGDLPSPEGATGGYYVDYRL